MTIVHICTYVLDLIFPPSPDALLVRELNENTVLSLSALQFNDGVYSLSRFGDTRVRALIHEAKFHENKKAHRLLGILFAHALTQVGVQKSLIIPLPLSKKRERERGHNQVTSALKIVTLPDEITLRTDILVRTRHTRPQTELKRRERLVNVRDAFGVAHGEDLRDTHIILVDDVVTTGATLREAKAALLSHSPASVTCIAFAH